MARNAFNQNDLRMRISSWMQGRYGVDELTRGLLIFGCVLVAINFIVNVSVLSVLSCAVFAVGIFRTLSRNFSARTRELKTYQRSMEKPKAWWRLLNKRYENRHTTLYFTCKGCGSVLNVPRGRGKLLVTCPKCGTKTKKKS